MSSGHRDGTAAARYELRVAALQGITENECRDEPLIR